MLEPTQRKFTTEEHAQLTAIQKRQEGRELDARLAASEMALRQWCVEQAVKSFDGISREQNIPNAVTRGAISDEALAELAGEPGSFVYVQHPLVLLAESILDFVTAPLKPEVPK